MSTGGSSCQACGGFIGEPGKVYGYAGKWCSCIHPGPFPGLSPFQPGLLPLKPDEYEEIRRKAIDDLMKQPPGRIEIGPPPAPMTITPPTSPAMTPAEFVVWLRGYLSAYGTPASMTQGDWKHIAAKLDTLGGPK